MQRKQTRVEEETERGHSFTRSTLFQALPSRGVTWARAGRLTVFEYGLPGRLWRLLACCEGFFVQRSIVRHFRLLESRRDDNEITSCYLLRMGLGVVLGDKAGPVAFT
jgi:hypothetical protein